MESSFSYTSKEYNHSNTTTEIWQRASGSLPAKGKLVLNGEGLIGSHACHGHLQNWLVSFSELKWMQRLLGRLVRARSLGEQLYCFPVEKVSRTQQEEAWCIFLSLNCRYGLTLPCDLAYWVSTFIEPLNLAFITVLKALNAEAVVLGGRDTPRPLAHALVFFPVHHSLTPTKRQIDADPIVW